jgi:phage terminase small subunit
MSKIPPIPKDDQQSKKRRACSRDAEGKLTPKQKFFVDEYLIDLNATQAAIRAGYSARTAGRTSHEYLKKPVIQKFLSERLKSREERTEINQDYVLTTIKETIERCKSEDGFDPSNTLKGCELLGRNLKMWTDKVEHSVDSETVDLIHAARKRTPS